MTYINEAYGGDGRPHDTLVQIVNTTYKKLKVRLEIVNYFNDQRPLIIHQISINDKFYADVTPRIANCGAHFDPLFRAWHDTPYPEIKEIPILSAIKYEEIGNSANSDFVAENKYLEIGGNKSFIVDFEIWVKDIQNRLVCMIEDCKRCLSVEPVQFKRISSELNLLVDRPDFDDNTKIEYGIVEKVAIGSKKAKR